MRRGSSICVCFVHNYHPIRLTSLDHLATHVCPSKDITQGYCLLFDLQLPDQELLDHPPFDQLDLVFVSDSDAVQMK